MRPLCRLTLNAALVVVAAAGADPSYSRDVRPILQRSCQGCHQPNLKSSDLDLTTYAGLTAGGKGGAALRPGAPDESALLRYVTGELKPQMPIGQPPLPAEQIALLKAWIAAGAKDDTPATAQDTGKPVSYSQAPVITALAFSPDGNTIAVSAYREILLIPASGTTPAKRLGGVSERFHGLAFSADARTLVAVGGTPARFGEVQVWDTAAAKLLRSMTLTGDTVFGGALSPDGSTVAVGCSDNTVRLLDVGTGKELHRIGNHENWVLGTVFSRDGKRVVSVARDRAARLSLAILPKTSS
jgi:mono/diheme cytochrome c family protein